MQYIELKSQKKIENFLKIDVNFGKFLIGFRDVKRDFFIISFSNFLSNPVL